MENGKKTILLISLAVIAIGASGIYYFYSGKSVPGDNMRNTSHDPLSGSPTSSIQQNSGIFGEENSIYSTALKKNDYSVCNKIIDVDLRNDCLSAYALKKNDFKACSSLSKDNYVSECIDIVRYDKILKSGSLGDCSAIHNKESRESCVVSLAASKEATKKQCSELGDDIRATCLEYVMTAMAVKNNDIADCLGLSNKKSIDNCIDLFAIGDMGVGDCSHLESGPDKDKCSDTVLFKKAKASKDDKRCEEIKLISLKLACKDFIDPKLDTDKDGLSNIRERIYGSDPNNPDTDNDKFKDGDEVRRGFNPLGDGKLPKYE